MPRLARKDFLYDGCTIHCISRSIRKMKIFKDDLDFQNFLTLIKKHKTVASIKLFHYCLMHTHFHMVVQINQLPAFSKFIQQIKSQYTTYYHTKYNISGPIWRERYKSLLIENDQYLYACGQYIEDNPVKSKLVSQAHDWDYSSRLHYETQKRDELIDNYDNIPVLKNSIALFLEEKQFYEKGNVIGSALFRFQFSKIKSKI